MSNLTLGPLSPPLHAGMDDALQAASHPFITGQPHPRDLGALTIADDPLINDRYTRQVQAMQLQYQKDQQEAERKRAQRTRQQVRVAHELARLVSIAFEGKGSVAGGQEGRHGFFAQ